MSVIKACEMKSSYFWRAIFFLFLAADIQAATRVALMDFSADDISYRSAQAAADFSALLQAKLMSVDNVDWVERSQLQAAKDELGLTSGGYVSASSALNLGKFVKADLLIEGQFVFTGRPNRELRLEVIDLDHAEVLAERATPIQGATNKPVEVSVVDIEAAGKAFDYVFHRALERRAQIKTQTVIAPLFFANISKSRRLDHFENELQSALNNTLTNHNLCVLQFPRADTAVSEAELVLAGLVEQDPTAWQKVADVYVWGQYEEVRPSDFAFIDTPVSFTLNLWDGSSEVKTITETAKVSELPQLKERIIQHMLATAQSFKKQAVADNARRQVAKQLLSRANEIQILFKPESQTYLAASFKDTEEGKQLWHYQLRLLTTAHFFAPESYIIHHLWFDCRWSQPSTSFRQQMERIHDYDDFNDKYGQLSPVKAESDLSLNGEWSALKRQRPLDCLEYQNEWLNTQNDICYEIDGENSIGFPIEKPPDFPIDAPNDVLESWKTQVRDDFARRSLTMYEKGVNANPPIPLSISPQLIDYKIVSSIKDKQLKAKYFEVFSDSLWLSYLWHHHIDQHRREFTAEEFDDLFTRGLFSEVRQVFADVGQLQESETILAKIKQKINIITNTTDVTADAAQAAAALREANQSKIIQVNLLPPRLTPNIRSVLFQSANTKGAVALKFNDNSLWVSTRGGDLTLNNPTWEYLVSSDTNAALWRFKDSTVPEALSSALGKQSKITSFCVQNDKLWMTLEEDGVCSLTPSDLKSTFYGDAEGVLSRQMFVSALMANRLYFGGGEPVSGKLNYLELPEMVWKSLDLGKSASIKLLQSIGHYLLVNNRVFDADKGVWQSLKYDVLAAVADSDSFWLGTTRGLVLYNPNTKTEHDWASLPGGYFVDTNGNAKTTTTLTSGMPGAVMALANDAHFSRLPGAVTALANDGDFLWVGATTRFDRLQEGNGNEGGWLNGRFVLTLTPGFGIGNAFKNGDWRNMYVRNECNYVLLFHKPTGKWIGYFPVTSRVTSLAVSNKKLWIGLEDVGYVQYEENQSQDQEVYAPSPLLEVDKQPLLSISQNNWVSDEISPDELHSRIQDAVQVLKTPPKIPVDMEMVAEERYEFLQKHFSKFVPVQFQKETNGDAVIQQLHVRENMFEYNGEYYTGFKFTVPQWLDGDFEWMHVLAKTATEKDFRSGTMTWYILPESGKSEGFDDFSHESLANYPQLQNHFLYTKGFYRQSLDENRLMPGKTYAIWFGFKESNMPDIAFAMTIDSIRGANECGILPLR